MRVPDALALLRRDKVVTLTPTGRVRSIVEEVVGEAVKGSWWGHPKGKAIYACAQAVSGSGEAVAVKLIAGKVTFVHRDLWPALYRVATDAGRRAALAPGLSPEARDLLARVEEAGELRLDRLKPAPAPRAREALEKALLCLAEDLHTEKGSHTKVLTTWERWADAGVRRAAEALALERARAVLAAACGGALAI